MYPRYDIFDFDFTFIFNFHFIVNFIFKFNFIDWLILINLIYLITQYFSFSIRYQLACNFKKSFFKYILFSKNLIKVQFLANILISRGDSVYFLENF